MTLSAQDSPQECNHSVAPYSLSIVSTRPTRKRTLSMLAGAFFNYLLFPLVAAGFFNTQIPRWIKAFLVLLAILSVWELAKNLAQQEAALIKAMFFAQHAEAVLGLTHQEERSTHIFEAMLLSLRSPGWRIPEVLHLLPRTDLEHMLAQLARLKQARPSMHTPEMTILEQMIRDFLAGNRFSKDPL